MEATMINFPADDKPTKSKMMPRRALIPLKIIISCRGEIGSH